MELTIKRLTPALLADYLRFFDETEQDDGVPEHKCYCVCWSSGDCEQTDDSTAQARRRLAQQWVADGSIQGYLAYAQGRVVGWCNANARADCQSSRAGRMYLRPMLAGMPEGENVKSVFCFVVAPQARRQGVAGALLARVCEDARAEGYDAVESYPLKEFVSTRFDYMGPARLYQRQGFTQVFDLGDRAVMRKPLR